MRWLAGTLIFVSAISNAAAMRMNHARVSVNGSRGPSNSSESKQIKLALNPPGRYIVVNCPNGEVGGLKTSGEEAKPLIVDCDQNEKSGFTVFWSINRTGSRSRVSAGSNIQVCTKAGDVMTLIPGIAQKLLPDSESHISVLGADYCLTISLWTPPAASPQNWFSVAKSSSSMKSKLKFNKVALSPLLAIESWLFYSGGQGSDLARAVQDGSLHKELHEKYEAAGQVAPIAEELELAPKIEVDLDRWYAFGEIALPPSVSVDDAKGMLRQVIIRRFRQSHQQCWNGNCVRENYAQAFVYIAGSLLAVALQACVEQIEYKLAEVGNTLDPAAVTFDLFTRYLDSDIGTFHVPQFLQERLPSELHAVFGAYVSGESGMHMFAPVTPPKAEVDMMTRMHMDKIVMQYYPTLAFTASSSADSLDSSRGFWHYFFKLLGSNVDTDNTVMFHRTSLLLALNGPQVMVREQDPSFDTPILSTTTFPDVLKDWLGKRAADPDDFEAPVMISTFTSGLREAMRASEGMSVGMLRTAYQCSDNDKLKYKTYQFFSLCRNSLTNLRLSSI